jgi:hypothetical protein
VDSTAQTADFQVIFSYAYINFIFIKYLKATDGDKHTVRNSGKVSVSKMLVTLQLPEINSVPTV